MFRSLLLQIWMVLAIFVSAVLCSVFLVVSVNFEQRLDAVDQTLSYDVAAAAADELRDDLALAAQTRLSVRFRELESRDPRMEWLLLDTTGHFVASGGGRPSAGEQREALEVSSIEQLLRHHGPLRTPVYSHSDTPEYDGRMMTATRVSLRGADGYLVGLRRTRSSNDGSDTRALLSVPRLLLLGGSLAAALFAAWAFSFFIVRQLREMIAALQSFDKGNFLHRITATPSGDLGRYAAAINSMAGRTEEALTALQSLGAERKKLLASIAHDLKRPVTFLSNAAETLCSDTPLTGDQERELVERLTKRAQDFSRRISIFSDLSRLGRPEARVDKIRVDLRTELRHTVALFESSARAKELSLSFTADEGLFEVFGDPSLLRRAVENLIENALLETAPGGFVRVTLAYGNSRARISIADNGSGIAPEDIPRLFTPLARGSRTSGEGRPGSGLGLAIVRQIVELHSGTVSVESTLHVGSTFIIELPLL